jgi:hypothetical protein
VLHSGGNYEEKKKKKKDVSWVVALAFPDGRGV